MGGPQKYGDLPSLLLCFYDAMVLKNGGPRGPQEEAYREYCDRKRMKEEEEAKKKTLRKKKKKKKKKKKENEMIEKGVEGIIEKEKEKEEEIVEKGVEGIIEKEEEKEINKEIIMIFCFMGIALTT